MKIKQTLITALLTIAILLLSPLQAGAYAFTDIPESGTITILMKNRQGESLVGAGFSIYRVAALENMNGQLTYSVTDDFIDANVGIDITMTAEQNKSAAKALTEYAVLHKIDTERILVNNKGEAVTSNLSSGLYLVSQSVPVEGYYDIPPFLVALPATNPDGQTLVYNLTVTPKIQGVLNQNRNPTLTPTPTPTPATSVEGDNRYIPGSETQTQTGVLQAGKLPQTGMLLWPVVVLAVSGLLIFCLGWADVNMRRKKDE